jgi:hypothetical protein
MTDNGPELEESLGDHECYWRERCETAEIHVSRLQASVAKLQALREDELLQGVADRLLEGLPVDVRDVARDGLIDLAANQAELRSCREVMTTVEAERDQLRLERDIFRDQALPEAATIMNGLSAALAEANAERDQLRAIVRGAQEWSEAHRVWMNQAKGEGVQPTDEASRHQAATAAAMLDLIDHLDPPDGDGGATIELLAAMYGCVRDLIAERDRLRSIVDIVRDAFLRPSDDEWKIDSGALDALDKSAEATDG